MKWSASAGKKQPSGSPTPFAANARFAILLGIRLSIGRFHLLEETEGEDLHKFRARLLLGLAATTVDTGHILPTDVACLAVPTVRK